MSKYNRGSLELSASYLVRITLGVAILGLVFTVANRIMSWEFTIPGMDQAISIPPLLIGLFITGIVFVVLWEMASP